MAPELTPGAEVGSYRIEAPIGRGGMGVVYRALDLKLGRQVALKVLSRDRAEDDVFRDRFLRESRILASLDDPHIVPIFEAGEDDGQLFIAMRLVPGPDLRAVLETESRVRPARAVEIIAQVASALDAAHVRGLVHRDVKPANVLLAPASTAGQQDHVYLSDFGLTKQSGSESGLTAIGQFVGTPGFVAPEQIEGKILDHRVDIYALGCVLYSALTGERAYPRDTTIASLWAHLKEAPPSAAALVPQVPRALDAVIERAMARDPKDRYQTAGGLAVAARHALASAPAAPRDATAATVVGAATVALGATAAADRAAAAAVPRGPAATSERGGGTVVGVSPTMAAAPVAAGTAQAGGSRDAGPPSPPPTSGTVPGAGSGGGDPSRRRIAAIVAGGLAGLLGAAGLAFAFVLTPAAGLVPSASSPNLADASAMASGDMANMAGHAGPTHGTASLGPAGPAIPSPMGSMDMSMSSEEPTLPPSEGNKLAPIGGKVVINRYSRVTTSRIVTIEFRPEPFDRSGVSHMKVSNTPIRPSGPGRPYAAKFTWTLPVGVAGRRTVYAWFGDGTGQWTTSPAIDFIDFDHAPRAISDEAFHAHMFGDCPGIAANGYVELPVLPRLGRDVDGIATLRVTRAWDMGSNAPWPVQPGGQTVRVAIAPRTGFSERVITGMFELADNYQLKATGNFLLHLGPCP